MNRSISVYLSRLNLRYKGEFMSMSTIQQFSTDFHRSMRHFSKLVHLPKVLRSCNVNKSRGINISELFEWAIGTIFSRYSFERATADFTLHHENGTQLLKRCSNELATTSFDAGYESD